MMLPYPFLTKLGVNECVQEFFAESYQIDKNGNLIFHYDQNNIEHFGQSFHLVPNSNNCWLCGNIRLAKQIFICSSAMEAICFSSINLHKFKNLESLLFIAVGNKISEEQINWIKSRLTVGRIGLIFSNDVLGQISDVKIALALSNLGARISIIDERIIVKFKEKTFCLNQSNFSYSAFCKATNFRSHIRTFKSKSHVSFLEQLVSN